MVTMNESTEALKPLSSQPAQPTMKPVCPHCPTPLNVQFKEPLVYWCGLCRKWLDGTLKLL